MPRQRPEPRPRGTGRTRGGTHPRPQSAPPGVRAEPDGEPTRSPGGVRAPPPRLRGPRERLDDPVRGRRQKVTGEAERRLRSSNSNLGDDGNRRSILTRPGRANILSCPPARSETYSASATPRLSAIFLLAQMCQTNHTNPGANSGRAKGRRVACRKCPNPGHFGPTSHAHSMRKRPALEAPERAARRKRPEPRPRETGEKRGTGSPSAAVGPTGVRGGTGL